MPDLRAVFDLFASAIEGVTGLTQSPYPIDPSSIATGQGAGAFSLDMSTSPHPDAPGRWRENGRVRNTFVVTWLRPIKTSTQVVTQQTMLDDADAILNGAMNRTNNWQQGLAVEFVDASQSVSPSHEWMYGRMRFLVDHYVELT